MTIMSAYTIGKRCAVPRPFMTERSYEMSKADMEITEETSSGAYGRIQEVGGGTTESEETDCW